MNFLRLFALAVLLALAPFAARAQTADPSGDWRGVLAVGAVNLRVAMHLGAAASTIDSPDQSAFGMPAQMAATGRHVTVTVPSIGAVFEGEYRGLQFSYDDDHARLGLGSLLQLHQVTELCAEGVLRYDLGTEMDYKRRWAEEIMETEMLVLVR